MVSNWISQYTRDDNFDIVHVSGNGDCFFTATQKALESPTCKVTVAKLRSIVAQNITEQIFLNYFTIWKDAQKENDAELMMRFMFMQGVENLETLKRVIQTSRFWGNETAISILENALCIKFIIFSQRKFVSKQFPCIECSEIIEEKINPQWYILLEYDGVHYNLVKYNDAPKLRFNDIPISLKVDLMGQNSIFRKKIHGFDETSCGEFEQILSTDPSM